jgi:hypothetical protein
MTFCLPVAYNEYNLTTSIVNEAKKSFYNDNPQITTKEFFKAAFDRGDKVIINAGDSEEDRKSFSETFPNADPYASTKPLP